MHNRIEHITIVGGGTAGWLTAMILNTFLNSKDQGPPVQVTVIESPRIPTVGVGEATVAGIVQLFNQLGINETEFFRACNASFKLGVRFENWAVDDGGQPIGYSHPFNFPSYLGGVTPAHHYNLYGPHSDGQTLAECMVPNPALIDGFRGPRRIGSEDYAYDISYSYHLDAGLFGQFLRDVAVARGVRHVQDDVTDVTLDERGFVASLQLAEAGVFPVELVVDCTGFRGLIIQKALGEPFEPFSDSLLCDSAIPIQIPHKDKRRLQPCTRSSAIGAGWVWRVPLYSRVGTGYVFSSAFRSDDEALSEFIDHVRAVGDLDAADPVPEPRVIRMRIGRTRRAWVKNCVAIGLAGGFVEPLESTAIYTVEMCARWLVGYLPDREVNPAFADRYNALVESLYDEVRDFIVSHYYTSNRPEPFWQAARSDIEVPERLRENLALWRRKLPDVTDAPASKLFNHWNYIYTLWPKGFFRDQHFPLEGSISRSHWDTFGRTLAGTRQQLLSALPNHYDLLTSIRDGVVPQTTEAASPIPSLPSDFLKRAAARPTVTFR